MTRTVKAVGSRPLAEWGVAMLAFENSVESGDACLVKPHRHGLLAAVVDGLGHGDQASAAAHAAVSTLEEHPDEPVASLLERCHIALQGTRGAVMSIASFNPTEGTVGWLGVGNVEAVLMRADPDVRPSKLGLMCRSGVVGYRLPRLRISVLPVDPGDTLVFVTDGIRSGFANDLPLSEPPQRIADYILSHYGKSTDDALALVIRYLGPAP